MTGEKELAARFADCGLRPTAQRLLIYRFLLQHRVHPSADTIYSALAPENPTLSRTTVYNALHAMEGAGLIRAVPMESGEQRFDADVSAHGHFVCGGCDTIFDFPLEATALQALCPPQFAAECGDVVFRGRCPDCRK